MNPASNLILVGPMGAGKSTIGKRLAEQFRLEFYDLDHEIEQRTGASVALIFELEGEEGFRKRETVQLAELLAGHDRLVSTGGGTVLAPENRELIRTRGYVVYLHTTVAQQMRRLERDRQRPLLAGGDRRARLEELAQARDPLYAEVADLDVPGENLSVANAAERIVAELERRWVRATPESRVS